MWKLTLTTYQALAVVVDYIKVSAKCIWTPDTLASSWDFKISQHTDFLSGWGKSTGPAIT